MKLEELKTPAFLVYEDVVASNCQKMIQNAEKRGLDMRPHMKTHKTMYVPLSFHYLLSICLFCGMIENLFCFSLFSIFLPTNCLNASIVKLQISC